jgi:HCOMODA/2-hydroxy-3-carboxy-muconic semialdehyde decarboxylase
MPTDLAQLRYDIALANRILAHEGVLDAFGHVSARHPDDPNKYLLSRSRGPELVEPDDILVFDLDSRPVEEPTVRLYGERVIHGEIFKARPDVMAVCHHHAPAILPYAITGTPLVPVYHLGATLGQALPVWDQRDEFGATNCLVLQPEEGRSLARALGPNWTVLMRRHGATVAGRSLQELVFRCIYGCRNAEYQTEARPLGHLDQLSPKETELAEEYNLRPGPVGRAFEYWTVRLDKAGFLPPMPVKAAAKKAVGKLAKKVTMKARAAVAKRGAKAKTAPKRGTKGRKTR